MFRFAVVIAIVAEVAAIVRVAYLAVQRMPAPNRLNWTEQP